LINLTYYFSSLQLLIINSIKSWTNKSPTTPTKTAQELSQKKLENNKPAKAVPIRLPAPQENSQSTQPSKSLLISSARSNTKFSFFQAREE
jgi:hypothetical protein